LKPQERPYIIAKAACSFNGFLDDSAPTRRVLSSSEDLAQVDSLRAECDAILIGANTLRCDNPRLTIKSSDLQTKRLNEGKNGNPLRVVLSSSGDFDPSANFFSTDAKSLVYLSRPVQAAGSKKLAAFADVVQFESKTTGLKELLADLYGRGVKKLLVEGGAQILGSFFSQLFVDRFRLAISSQIVSEKPGTAPRLYLEDNFLLQRRFTLDRVERLGEMTVMHYFLMHKPIEVQD